MRKSAAFLLGVCSFLILAHSHQTVRAVEKKAGASITIVNTPGFSVKTGADVNVVNNYANLPNPTQMHWEVWTPGDPTAFPPVDPVLVAWRSTASFGGGSGQFEWSSFAAPYPGTYNLFVYASNTTASDVIPFYVDP